MSECVFRLDVSPAISCATPTTWPRAPCTQVIQVNIKDLQSIMLLIIIYKKRTNKQFDHVSMCESAVEGECCVTEMNRFPKLGDDIFVLSSWLLSRYFLTDFGGKTDFWNWEGTKSGIESAKSYKMLILMQQASTFHPLPTPMPFCLRAGNVLTKRGCPFLTHNIWQQKFYYLLFLNIESMSPRINSTKELIFSQGIDSVDRWPFWNFRTIYGAMNRNRVEIGLSYRLARPHNLELIAGLLERLQIRALGSLCSCTWEDGWHFRTLE